MKVICNRGALLDGLLMAGNVVASRTPKPVLQCVKLTAEDNTLTIAATDLEVAIRYSDSQVQIERPGEALVPADKLRDIVRESVDDTLSIEVANDNATIKGQDSKFTIYTQNPKEFPPVPDFSGEADFEIAGGHLKQLIGQTLFAAAKESTRYAFNGVLVVAKGKTINLVSTDGRRLAQAKGDITGGAKLPKDGTKAIVPAKALQLIDKLIDDPEAAVSFQIRENQVIFHTADATLTSNLVEGQFPPYEDVIPKDTDKQMTAGTADFLSAVRRAALLTTEESKGVRLAFGKSGLKLTSRSPEAGEAEVNFPCKFEGTEMEIGFNPQFLTEALRVVDTDEISLELTAPNRPGLLKGGPNFLYVIMPVNLQQHSRIAATEGASMSRSQFNRELADYDRMARVKQINRPAGEPLGPQMVSFFKQAEKRRTKFGKIGECWAKLIPDTLNDHCALDTFSRGTLTVLVDSSAHLYELKQLLLAGLQQQLLIACKSAGLRKISLKPGRWYGDGEEGGRKLDFT